MALTRGSGTHAADNTVSGVISNGATWYETFQVKDLAGDDVTGLTSDEFRFQFRCSENDSSPELTLTTDDGTITVSESDGVTTVTINVPQATIANMDGDYVADLVSKAASDDRLTHRAHGVVTFRNSPIAF
jgi:hypothetical protein